MDGACLPMVHSTTACGGTMGVGQWRQFEFMAAAERKPYNRASPGRKQANLAALAEMHPYSRFAGLPPEGEVLAVLCLKMLMSPKAERRVNLPLRGRCRRQKGCISSAPQARLFVFPCRRKAAYKSHRPKGDTTTLSHVVAVKPKNLKNLRLREPSTLTPQPRPFHRRSRRFPLTKGLS